MGLRAVSSSGVASAVVEEAGLVLPLNSALKRWEVAGATVQVALEDSGALYVLSRGAVGTEESGLVGERFLLVYSLRGEVEACFLYDFFEE